MSIFMIYQHLNPVSNWKPLTLTPKCYIIPENGKSKNKNIPAVSSYHSQAIALKEKVPEL